MKKTIASLKYDAAGLIPAVVQDDATGEVLMVAYMNRQSLEKTVSTGYTHFWSRSRQKFWMKGETSGHVQEVRRILFDCDRDTLVVKVVQHGPGACHTGHRSCFFTELTGARVAKKTFDAEKVYGGEFTLASLARVVADRKKTPRKRGSYTASLFRKGTPEILRKLGEEANEAQIAVGFGTKRDVVNEMADLLYHALVAMTQADVAFEDVVRELERRADRGTKKKTVRRKRP